jgi:uncharacterized protein
MRILNIIALTLVILGGLNWGLIGLFNYNLIAALFGVGTAMTNIVYVIIGLASVYAFYLFKPVTGATYNHRDSRREIHT